MTSAKVPRIKSRCWRCTGLELLVDAGHRGLRLAPGLFLLERRVGSILALRLVFGPLADYLPTALRQVGLSCSYGIYTRSSGNLTVTQLPAYARLMDASLIQLELSVYRE